MKHARTVFGRRLERVMTHPRLEPITVRFQLQANGLAVRKNHCRGVGLLDFNALWSAANGHLALVKEGADDAGRMVTFKLAPGGLIVRDGKREKFLSFEDLLRVSEGQGLLKL